MSFNNKTIVLTGAQGGIGKHLVALLEKDNANLIAIGRKPAVKLIQADLADEESLLMLCNKLKSTPVDILINLAGLMYFGDTTKLPNNELKNIISVNLSAPIQLTQAVLPQMLKNGQGHIVNIGSIFGSLPFPSFSAYSATKAGLKGFSDSLRREYSDRGISVSHISPRAVKTAFNTREITKFNQLTNANIDAPETVASIIYTAIAHKKKNLNIGSAETLFVYINALMPSIIDKALASKQHIANQILIGNLL